MRDPYRIPKPTSAFLQGNGAPQTEWWNFLNDLQQLFESSDTGLQAQITVIAYVLGSPDGTVANIPPINVGDYLPNTTQIFGEQSVLSVGTLAGGVVRLMLQNDQQAPGESYYYGTDTAGVKGWHALPEPVAVLPLVTGEIVSGQPVFVIADDGSLIYTEIE